WNLEPSGTLYSCSPSASLTRILFPATETISPLLMDRFADVDSVVAAAWANAIDDMARTTNGTQMVLLENPDIGPSPSRTWTPTRGAREPVSLLRPCKPEWEAPGSFA